MATPRFWIVMGASRGVAAIPYRHYSESLAFAESERLARLYGGIFYVLEAKGAAARLDVQIEHFNDKDEIPF